MKKVILLSIIFLVIPFSVMASGKTESKAEEDVVVNGVVEYFNGEVSINNGPVDFGTEVPYGSIIKTGPEAYCEVVFNNRNIFRIMESTVAEIRLSAHGPEIRIDEGSFAALFAKLEALTSEGPFRVKTGTTVASIRGTAFFIRVIGPETTYVCLCNGELELSGADGSKPEKYSSGHHSAFYISGNDGKTEIKRAPMLYHTDESMDSLAAHINEKINWYY